MKELNLLLAAVQGGDLETLAKCQITSNMTAEWKTAGMFILHYACDLGDVEVVRILLTIGGLALINSFDEIPLTPLAWAAKSENLELIEVLLESGADVNKCDHEVGGNSPLREVVEGCSFAVARMLIAAGADPLLRGWMRLSALDKARLRAKSGDLEACKILALLEAVV